MPDYHLRNANHADLDALLEVEQSWPEDARASADKFIARLDKFPQGVFLLEYAGKPVATLTSCPYRYDPAHPQALRNWDHVTNHGYLHDIGPLADYNALYIVSGVVATEHRGHEAFARGILAAVDLARRLSLRYVLGGAVIPGFARYHAAHPEASAADYAQQQRGSRLLDPLLDMYSRIGFTVPDAGHVIAEYFPDDASLNHAAIVVRDLHTD